MEIYKALAGDTGFRKVALCKRKSRRSLQMPPILLASKLIYKEAAEEFARHSPHAIDIPVWLWSNLAHPSRCPTLGVALPIAATSNQEIGIPARRLSLQLSLGVQVPKWNETLTVPHWHILSARWFRQLLQRIAHCQNLTELSIRWSLPSSGQLIADQALHTIFNELVKTVESMPRLNRYSIQIGSNAPTVSEKPQWGISLLSAYGRKGGKGAEWEDDDTIRHCCQEMPHGEWYDFLRELRLIPCRWISRE